MPKLDVDLPYFDVILTAFNKGDTDTEKAFGRHVHWGYWESPQSADGTIEDFVRATESLSRLICDSAGIKEGMRILDVGCGFGGTIASLNERFSKIELVGLNIDERQLQIAREKVLPLHENKIDFFCGNACELPFEDNSFDVVLAVECIFHFPDRSSFFKEASRVLRPGGKLALSEFVVSSKKSFSLFSIFSYFLEKFISLFYGKCNRCMMEDYLGLARNTELKISLSKDITSETMPTYSVLNTLFRKSKQVTFIAYLATLLTEVAHRSRRILYKVLVCEKHSMGV